MYTPIVDHQMEKKMEHDMETGFILLVCTTMRNMLTLNNC